MTKKQQINKLTYSDAMKICERYRKSFYKKICYDTTEAHIKAEARAFLRLNGVTPKEALV